MLEPTQENKLYSLILDVTKRFPIVLMSILGLSGLGKTNLSFRISEFLLSNGIYENFIYYEKFYKPTKIPNSIHVYDDVTYIVTKHHKEIDETLRDIMLYRHYAHRGFFIFIYHYHTSILPILRNSHINVVMSITSTQQLKELSLLFDFPSLWDFREIYQKKNFYALFNINGYHLINPIGISKFYLNFFYQKEKFYKQVITEDDYTEYYLVNHQDFLNMIK